LGCSDLVHQVFECPQFLTSSFLLVHQPSPCAYGKTQYHHLWHFISMCGAEERVARICRSLSNLRTLLLIRTHGTQTTSAHGTLLRLTMCAILLDTTAGGDANFDSFHSIKAIEIRLKCKRRAHAFSSTRSEVDHQHIFKKRLLLPC
jgi:hypothetical protein